MEIDFELFNFLEMLLLFEVVLSLQLVFKLNLFRAQVMSILDQLLLLLPFVLCQFFSMLSGKFFNISSTPLFDTA